LLFVGLATGTSVLTGRAARDGSRTMLTFGDPNVCANYFFISIMVIWASGRPRRWSVRVGAYAVLTSALVTTGSNSGLISLAVGVVVAALLGIYRRNGIVPAVTMLMFISLGAYLVLANVNLTRIQERTQASRYAIVRDGIGRGQTSVAQRTSILNESIHLYRTGGPLGAGPVSTEARLRAEQAPFVKEAHDDYLAALTERGLLGLVGLALLIMSVAFRSLLGATKPLGSASLAMPRPNAVAGAIAGTFCAMAVLELLHARQVWTLFAIVALLSVWSRDWAALESS
jgi:O-antigen ligase